MKKVILPLMLLISLSWASLNLKNNTIVDKTSGLEWERNTHVLNWDKAVSYCQNLNLNALNWRLPDKNELLSIIVESSNREEEINRLFFNEKEKDFAYWTSSLSEENSHFRWGVQFSSGWGGLHNVRYFLNVRCVRGEVKESLPIAQTYGTVGKESEPFSDEKKCIILIHGDKSSSFRQPTD